MKKFRRLVFEFVIILPIVVVFLPLVYICFLVMVVLVPPALFATRLFEERKDNKPRTFKNISLQFFSIMICLSLVLLMITALLRSVILFLCSFYPAALFQLNQIHHDIIYKTFIPLNTQNH